MTGTSAIPTAPAARRSSTLRFIVYAAAGGLVAGVAVWLLFRTLGTEGWLAIRAPVSWFGLYIAPFALGFASIARLPMAERGWSSLLIAWLATAVFALGMNLTSLTGPTMLLAILVFVIPASTLGSAAAWLLLRRAMPLSGDPA